MPAAIRVHMRNAGRAALDPLNGGQRARRQIVKRRCERHASKIGNGHASNPERYGPRLVTKSPTPVCCNFEKRRRGRRKRGGCNLRRTRRWNDPAPSLAIPSVRAADRILRGLW